jgi:hypothetical protein
MEEDSAEGRGFTVSSLTILSDLAKRALDAVHSRFLPFKLSPGEAYVVGCTVSPPRVEIPFIRSKITLEEQDISSSWLPVSPCPSFSELAKQAVKFDAQHNHHHPLEAYAAYERVVKGLMGFVDRSDSRLYLPEIEPEREILFFAHVLLALLEHKVYTVYYTYK